MKFSADYRALALDALRADGRQLFWPDWLPVCWEPTL